VTGRKAKIGGSIIGLMFIAVGVIKLLQGGPWIVWFILGFLFGGLSAFSGKSKGSDES
jgi:hypothetical protein